MQVYYVRIGVSLLVLLCTSVKIMLLTMPKDEVAVQDAIGDNPSLERQNGFEYFISLPLELQLQTIGYLGQPELYALKQTSSGMNNLVSESGLSDIYLTPENYTDKKILDDPNARFRCLKIDMGLARNAGTTETDEYYKQCRSMLEKVEKLNFGSIDLNFMVYPSANMDIGKILKLANLWPIPKKVNFKLCFDCCDIEGLYATTGLLDEQQYFTPLFITAALKRIPGADFCFCLNTKQVNQYPEASRARLLMNVGYIRNLSYEINQVMGKKEFSEVEIKGPGLLTSRQALSTGFSLSMLNNFLFPISALPSKKLTIKNPPCGPADTYTQFEDNLYQFATRLPSKLDKDERGNIKISNIDIVFEEPIHPDITRAFCKALFERFEAVFEESGTASKRQISVVTPDFSEAKVFLPKQTVLEPAPNQRAQRPASPGPFIGRHGWPAYRL